MLESAWQPWKDLRDDTAAYNAEKEKTGELVLEQLDHVWSGIKNQVEITNVATPYT